MAVAGNKLPIGLLTVVPINICFHTTLGGKDLKADYISKKSSRKWVQKAGEVKNDVC